MTQLSNEQVFVRGVWASAIPRASDASWVERAAERPSDDGPLGDYSTLVRRMLAAGISSTDIARFAQIVGYETAFTVCYLLDDPNASFEGVADVEAENIDWQLFATDPDTGETLRPISGLHERLLLGDPSGREMRAPH